MYICAVFPPHRAIDSCIVTRDVSSIIVQGLLYRAIDPTALVTHIQTVEDADYLRGQLRELGLVAFVANDSVLPRTSGAQDTPMRLATSPPAPPTSATGASAGAGAGATLNGAISFLSPPSMQVQVQLPHRGVVTGMGVSRGVTLIVGGGFHGKSTLLKAIEAGVYNHIPGGCFCVCLSVCVAHGWRCSVGNVVLVYVTDRCCCYCCCYCCYYCALVVVTVGIVGIVVVALIPQYSPSQVMAGNWSSRMRMLSKYVPKVINNSLMCVNAT